MGKKVIILIAAVLIISLGLNLWFLGGKVLETYEQRFYQRGANDVIASVLIQLQQEGEVTINTGNEQLILVIKEIKRVEELNSIPDTNSPSGQ